MNIRKTDKTKINWRYIAVIKQEYFNWMKAPEISKKYWYNINCIIKYLKSKATKTYIDSKWVRWRRCSICIVYKKESEYSTNYDKKKDRRYLASHCKVCDCRRNTNNIIIQKNKWEGWKQIRKSREAWHKHKWKYNIRRRILRTIWYLDWNWVIIRNFNT